MGPASDKGLPSTRPACSPLGHLPAPRSTPHWVVQITLCGPCSTTICVNDWLISPMQCSYPCRTKSGFQALYEIVFSIACSCIIVVKLWGKTGKSGFSGSQRIVGIRAAGPVGVSGAKGQLVNRRYGCVTTATSRFCGAGETVSVKVHNGSCRVMSKFKCPSGRHWRAISHWQTRYGSLSMVGGLGWVKVSGTVSRNCSSFTDMQGIPRAL
jgi:hypothetical protein